MPRVKFELKNLETPTLFFNIANADAKPTALAGTWGAVYPTESVVRFELRADGNTLTGSYVARGTQFEIYGGSIGSDTISFKIKSPDGERTISFVGKLNGDKISFQRVVEVRPGGRPGGAFIWGSGGPKSFSAAREP